MMRKQKCNLVGLLHLIPFLLLSYSLSAQNYKVLAIGDTIPTEVMKWMLTDQATGKYVSEAENKLIVLDFWNVLCTTCTADFPRLDSIQKENTDKLQIISVTSSTDEGIDQMRKKRAVRFPDVLKITGDTILNKIFPHALEPMHVWINKDGKILYKANYYNLTTANIEAVLRNEFPFFAEMATMGNYADERSLLEMAGTNLRSEPKYSSILVPGQYIYASYTSQSPNAKDPIKIQSAIKLENADILHLYRVAFSDQLFQGNGQFFNMYFKNWISIKIKDNTAFQPPSDKSKLDSWLKKNMYWYELILPEAKLKDKYKIMQQDLNRYLDYKAQIIKQKKQCVILEKISSLDKIKTADLTRKSESFYKDHKRCVINTPLTEALYALMVIFNGEIRLPIVNETGSNENVDIIVDTRDIKTLDDLDKQLRPMGLRIKTGLSNVSILEITD